MSINSSCNTTSAVQYGKLIRQISNVITRHPIALTANKDLIASPTEVWQSTDGKGDTTTLASSTPPPPEQQKPPKASKCLQSLQNTA